MKRGKFTIIRGSSRPPLTITITDSDGAAIDLTGATAAKLVASGKQDSEVADLAINKTLSFLEPRTAGQVRAAWSSAEVAAIESGSYVGQVEVVLSDGQTAIWGDCDIIVWPPRKKQT